jgi:protein TonB
VEAIASLDELPKPLAESHKSEPVKPNAVTHTEVPKSMPAPISAPVPVAIQDAIPTPNSATGTTVAQPAPSPIGTPTVSSKSAPEASIATKVELPSSSAEYLHNPKPVYPNISKRRGEQGMVLVSVLIGIDGTAQDAKVKTSSGFELLDQAALNTVKNWRYVPGKRGGLPEAMWFNVPINFVLE